jgi:hypothetical protein
MTETATRPNLNSVSLDDKYQLDRRRFGHVKLASANALPERLHALPSSMIPNRSAAER